MTFEKQLISVPAVILAGGKAKPDMIAETGLEHRALIPFNGKTMLEHVVGALKNTEYVHRIVVVGDMPENPDYERIPDQGGFVDNVFAGLEQMGDVPFVLFCTSDIPFLTQECVENFVVRGQRLDVDMVYPIVRVNVCYDRFPGVKRTALRLQEDTFTGGNLMLVRPAFMKAQRSRIAKAYSYRKSPLRLAMMLGLGTTLRVGGAMTIFPKMLSVGRLEDSASKMLGGTARALVSDYPELATDIDRPSDLIAIQG